MNQEQILASIDWCLVQLKAEQNPDGSFTSTTREYIRGTVVASHNRRTTFYPSAIVLALEQNESRIAEEIRNQAVAFLLQESGPTYEYHYWTHDQTNLPSYPPDLDDTLLALTAIHSVDERLITGKCLAWLLRHLITNEKKPGGPYRTWLSNSLKQASWHDIDGVVNANIHFALHKLGIKTPILTEFCQQIVYEQRWYSSYYIGIWPMLYSLARLPIWQNQTVWIPIWQEYINSPNDLLGQALVLSSAIRTNSTDHTGLQKLAAKLVHACTNKNVLVDDCSYIMERHGADITELSGSKSWTLAAIAESLELFRKKFFQSEKIGGDKNKNKRHERIIGKIKNRFASLSPELQKKTNELITKIDAQDPRHEITLSAYFTNEYTDRPLSNQDIEKIDYLNTLNWLTCQIHNNLFDETKHEYLLAIAQLVWREIGNELATLCYGKNTTRQQIVAVIDEVDSANALEFAGRLKHQDGSINLARTWPNIAQNAESSKSIGLSIGVSLVFALGGNVDVTVINKVTTYYRHYLTAKQICDDIHDWENDLTNLQINPTIIALLKEYSLVFPEKDSLNLNNDLQTLREIFWYKVMPSRLVEASEHCVKAASWCRDLPWLTRPDFFLENIQIVSKKINSCRSNFLKTNEFLNTYANFSA